MRVVLLPLLVLASPAMAACDADYVGGKPPIEMAVKLRVSSTLCFDEFAVGYAAQTRTPLWSAEDLTAQHLSSHVPRKDEFHAETQLPIDARAEIKDYTKSGFDKGHMTPADDESTAEAERQSFTLANMVPQDPKLNRGLWAHIEARVRALAERDQQVYVVTGPIFGDGSVVPDGRIRVPSQTFKAVADLKGRVFGAYVADNSADERYTEVSIAKLDTLAGLNLFPGLPQADAAAAPNLPPP